MRTRALVTTAALVLVVAGCDRTTSGTVAMTTEAGPTTRISSPFRPPTLLPSAPGTRSPAPAPGDALGVTCAEYVQLDPASQASLIEEILRNKASVLSPGEAEIAKSLADAVCTFLPDSPVSEILIGETPP